MMSKALWGGQPLLVSAAPPNWFIIDPANSAITAIEIDWRFVDKSAGTSTSLRGTGRLDTVIEVRVAHRAVLVPGAGEPVQARC